MNTVEMQGHFQYSCSAVVETIYKKESSNMHFVKDKIENYENAHKSSIRNLDFVSFKNDYHLLTVNHIESNASKCVMTILKDTNSLGQAETIKCRQKSINNNKNSDSLALNSEDISNLLLKRKAFDVSEDLKDHKCIEEKVDPLKCKYCSFTFNKKSHPQNVDHIINQKQNDCTICGAQFGKRKAFCKHLKTGHNISEPEKIYQCSFCDKKFSKKLYLIYHLKVHADGQYVCIKCGYISKSESEYSHHSTEHLKQFKYNCDLCGKKFARRQQHDQHMMGHNRHSCSQCNVTFSTKKLFWKHQHSVHGIRIELPKVHKCSVCKKSFIRRQFLLWHMRVHTGEKPLKCSHCDKSFRNNGSLAKHMKSARHLQRVSIHEGKVIEIEKPYQCVQCGARFYRHNTLCRHIRLLHSICEIFKCSHCNYSSKSKTNLKRHEQCHSDIKRFVCEICGLSFRTLSTLKEHNIFLHTEDRHFTCQICLKSFKSNSILQRHFKTHCEIRPFKCHCGRNFKRLSHLKRHMSSVHSAKETSEISDVSQVSNAKESDVPLALETLTFLIVPYSNKKSMDVSSESEIVEYVHSVSEETQNSGVPSNQSLLTNNVFSTEDNASEDMVVALTPISDTEVSVTNPLDTVSLDDPNLNLSLNSFCNFNLASNSDVLENNISTFQDSIAAHDILSVSSSTESHSSLNSNYHDKPSSVDAFHQLPPSSAGLQMWPFLMSDDISSPPHSDDLNISHSTSSKDIFENSDDVLSLAPYGCSLPQSSSSEHLFNSVRELDLWDISEHNKFRQINSGTDDNFYTNLPTSTYNILPYNMLFSNDSLMACALNSDLEPLTNLC